MGLLNLIRRRKPEVQAQAAAPIAPVAPPVAAPVIKVIRARYDAAQNTPGFKNYWANADQLDADSAHSPQVRHSLIARSRYEVGNNGYADGIAQTYSTDVVGTGPLLRMQSGSDNFNQMVEREFYAWCKAVHFRRKLWCMVHAKHTDGEGFGSLRQNNRIRHAVKMDVVLHEAEQVQTPYLPFEEAGYIDGIKFDQFGNVEWYDLLQHHPGATNGLHLDMTPERIPADRMLHWFKLRRPGQHRGVVECASTLNTGASARRWREATLIGAETAAELTMFLETTMAPEEVESEVNPMEQFEITKRMMTALPAGYKPFQMSSEYPTASHESFHKTLVNEQARPKSMPYNKAACDSSSYNYSSGRLDHQTYYSALDVDREDCNDLVLDPLFDAWFDLAIIAFGWLGGNPLTVSDGARAHSWDWPKHRVADVESEANANQTALQSGQIGLHQIYTDGGLDLEDEIPKMALTFGVTPEEIRRRLLDITLPSPTQPQASPQPDEAVAAALRNLLRRGELPKVNGVHHAN